MRTESRLFTGVAAFFAVVAVVYWWYGDDPAGTAALALVFLMSSLVAFFLWAQARRRGARPEDREDGEVRERAGPLDFFPAGSPWPPVLALGFAVLASGLAVGLWLFLIGAGVTVLGVLGFVMQYANGGDEE